MDKSKYFAEKLVEELVSASAAYYDSDLQTDPFRLARLQKAKADAIQALRVPSPHSEDFPGMRDQMAIAALPAIIEANKKNMKISFAGEAEQAYKYADAMMIARNPGASTPEGAA